jgi:hypothetical protein
MASLEPCGNSFLTTNRERPTNPGELMTPAIEDVRRIFAPQTNDAHNFLTTT